MTTGDEPVNVGNVMHVYVRRALGGVWGQKYHRLIHEFAISTWDHYWRASRLIYFFL